MSDALLVQTMKGILGRLDQIDDIKAEIKEEYAQAKAAGFDKTALGSAIREIRGRDKAETPAAQERAAFVDLYVSIFDNAPRTYVHVPAREAGSTIPSREHAPVTQEANHVDRGASARPHSATGEPAIPSKAGDAGTGQASATDTTGQPTGAGTGSAVRAGAPISEIATPEFQTAAQSEAAAGSTPEQGADECASGNGACIAAQSAQFVTPSGEGEGAATPADPSPAADEPIKGLAAANAIAARAAQPSAPKVDRAEIDIEIPAFLRRTNGGNHPSFGEQA